MTNTDLGHLRIGHTHIPLANMARAAGPAFPSSRTGRSPDRRAL